MQDNSPLVPAWGPHRRSREKRRERGFLRVLKHKARGGSGPPPLLPKDELVDIVEKTEGEEPLHLLEARLGRMDRLINELGERLHNAMTKEASARAADVLKLHELFGETEMAAREKLEVKVASALEANICEMRELVGGEALARSEHLIFVQEQVSYIEEQVSQLKKKTEALDDRIDRRRDEIDDLRDNFDADLESLQPLFGEALLPLGARLHRVEEVLGGWSSETRAVEVLFSAERAAREQLATRLSELRDHQETEKKACASHRAYTDAITGELAEMTSHIQLVEKAVVVCQRAEEALAEQVRSARAEAQ